ncbi:MAG: oligosaccharide flippase family protein [Flavobacteriales bacterium]
MQKKFITNLFFLLTLNFLIKPFYILGIDAEIINRVGEDTYGLYFSLFNFSFLFSIFLDLGINSFNTKNIAQNENLFSKYFSNLLSLKLVLFVVYILLTAVAGFVWGYSMEALKILSLLAVNQGIAAVTLYLRSNLGGSQMFMKDSVISVLDRFLMIIICSTLLWGNITDKPFQIEWYIYAQTVSYSVTLLFALYWVWKKSSYVKVRLNRVFSLAIFKQSFPYALLVLLMTFYYRSDSVMLEKMLPDGNAQSGYYAQSYRFFEAGNMVAYLFSVLLFPIFSKMIKEKECLGGIVKMAFKIIFSGAIIVCALCFQFGDEILNWRYNSLSPQSVDMFAVLMTCFVFISTTYVFGTLLTANGNLKVLNILAGFAVVLNIGLNLIFIPKWQALGSAVASLITQGFVSIVQIIIVKKKFNFNIKPILYIQFIVFILGVYLIANLSDYYIANWTISAGIFFVSTFLFALSINMIPIKKMIYVLRNE